jgi:glycerol-3-phosphate dehydrogenase
LFRDSEGQEIPEAGVYSRDTCFVIDGAPEEEFAVALQGSSIDTGSVIDRGARHLFVVPWRGKRLIGVWHIIYNKSPDELHVSEDELQRFLEEINGAFRGERIDRDQIRMVNAGLVPFGASDEAGQELAFGKKSHLIDSAPVHGLEGLVTLIGVRHTMARGDSVKAMKIIDKKLGRSGAAPDSSVTPLLGGDVHDFEALTDTIPKILNGQGTFDMRSELVALYGSGVDRLLKDAELRDQLRRVEDSDITEAQIKLAVRDEQAVTLGDVVFRRTPLAAAGNPGERVLSSCSRIMGTMLGWNSERVEKEVQSVIERFPTATHCGRISEPEIESLVDS